MNLIYLTMRFSLNEKNYFCYMRNIFLILLFPIYSISQSLYNPQLLYDNPGGIFDEDSLRSIYLDFYNPNRLILNRMESLLNVLSELHKV